MKLEFDVEDLNRILNPINEGIESIPSFTISNISIDSRSRSISEKTLFIAFKGSFSDGHKHLSEFKKNGGKIAVVEEVQPNVNLVQLQVKSSLRALQLIAIAHREKFDIPVVGITGSNGKTTVKEIIYQALKQHYNIVRSPKSYNSQIGVPLSVLEISNEHELGIFEAGISKPGEMELLEQIIQPTLGIFTGLGDAHAMNFSSDGQKQKEKYLLFKSCEKIFEADKYVLPKSNSFRTKAEATNFGLVKGLMEHLNVPFDKVREIADGSYSLAMRMERHAGINDSLILNDTYSADMNSLENALAHLENESNFDKKVLILSNFEETSLNKKQLEEFFQKFQLDELIFIDRQNPNFDVPKYSYFRTVEDFLTSGHKVERSVILIKGSHNSGFQDIVDFFTEKNHITRLEINLNAVRANLGYYRSKLKNNVKVLAMVKAQAYGSGIVELARLLEKEGVNYLGVAYSDEGIKLRKAGIKLPILVMNPELRGFNDLLKFKLEPSIYSIKLLDSFISFLIRKQIKRFPIHVKLDTGMNRLGFKQNDLEDLIDLLKTQPEIFVQSVFSHLAASNIQSEGEFTTRQIQKFETFSNKIEEEIGYTFIRHLSNSAGIVNYSQAHFDMVRLGIGLFGVDNSLDLETAVSFVSEISQIKVVERGESVGYSRTYIADKPIRIGIVPVGYADGISRKLGNGNFAFFINGEKCKTIGSICMDMLMVELPNGYFGEGDAVEILGDNISIVEMAKVLETVAYEILSNFSDRVQRVYLK